MERGGDLRPVEPQFIGNLLRFESRFVRQQLLDFFGVAHTGRRAFRSLQYRREVTRRL